VWFGRGPSIWAAALGVAGYNFFLVPPVGTFAVDDPKYFLTFALMFGVSIVMGELAAGLRRQKRDAIAREDRTAVLYALSKELASTDSSPSIAGIAARHAGAYLSCPAVVLARHSTGELLPLGAYPDGASLEAGDMGVARWSYERGELAGYGTNTLPGSSVLCSPLVVSQSNLGVLALLLRDRPVTTIEQRAFLEVLCRQVAVALERARLAEEARMQALRARTEEMRSSLLSAVSHDLRTPLASITGAATSLRDDSGLTPQHRIELTESIVEQAARLERLVANLLDMTRLDSGEVVLKKDWVPVEEVISSALTRLEAQLAARTVNVSISDDTPLVLVDPVLLEQLFVNLLENAVKYTPSSSAIEIRAQRLDEAVRIAVADSGPGLEPGTEEKVFDKFVRGAQPGGAGAGLGLAICRGIAQAHGGSIRAQNRNPTGLEFTLVLPIGGQPPSVSEPRFPP
jgi:two-component system sensor histidine kinase KdpD